MNEAPDSQDDCIRLAERWVIVRGHAHGLRGPVMVGTLAWPAKARWNTEALAALLRQTGGLEPEEVQQLLANGLDIAAFLALVPALERAAFSPVSHNGVQIAPALAQAGATQHSLALQSFQPRFTQAVLEWLVTTINLCRPAVSDGQRVELARSAQARLDEARSAFQNKMKSWGINWARIARACDEMDLPLQLLPRGYMNVGSGPNARLFKSTLTETTLALASGLARSKSLTASVLALHGLPVPAHQMVASEQEAVAAAHALGFPVVVKPDDRDGGMGVYAGLETDEQVRQFYAQAAAISPKVLVETHIQGQDFRITVDNGKVVKAIGRTPGGVLGDGRQSVEELIEALAAAKPALRGNNTIVSLDDEARELLAERGMTSQSVPAAGDYIVLRRRANMSTGGTSRDVRGELHPDNARLSIRAAQALRLDLAGIDLIIPDVSVSWMDCKAAICEVNSQPQISTEFAPRVYHDLLARLVPEPRRMRAVLLLNATGDAHCDASVIETAAQLTERGERVISVRSDGTWLAHERFAPPGRTPFAAAMAAELEPDATAVVVALAPREVLQQGLPWLHVDQVRVVRGANPHDASDAQTLRRCLDMVAPHAVSVEDKAVQ
ncbi:acetate--CoA ligase family protein [Caenimonas sp. SL110]|uniref:acetate--CoA ligase family protein n=1 Tax=Caenimonas sp. SL110 TaxID=1450524 RepID=UPI00069E838D|nr:acetate--CoA ligase family protein [Caenimonas sp. SL110]